MYQRVVIKLVMFLLNLVLMTRSMSLIIQGTDVGLVRCLLYKKLKIINNKKIIKLRDS
jgi:hypothetical protein